MTSIITSAGPSPAVLSSQILGTSTNETEESSPSYTFSFTPFLLKTYRHGVSPKQQVCKAYMQGFCPVGNTCPDRHISNNTRRGFGSNYNRYGDEANDSGGNLVCKHWLRGLCKKGEGCEFLHEYNLRKMPECTTFARAGYCPNGDECLYLHIDSWIKESLLPCQHYARGFCPLGPACSKSHRPKQLCPFYLAGFCPQGITKPAPALPMGAVRGQFDGFGGCEYGTHAKWIKESDLPPLKRKVVRTKEEIEEERERKRDEAEEREAQDGGGFRGRGGFGGGFRGNRGGRGGGFEGGWGFRGNRRGRY